MAKAKRVYFNYKLTCWISSLLLPVAALLALFVFIPHRASAVPSFSRQTGLPCSACHIDPPELTPLGREFKLNGYTMTGIKVISAKAGKSTPGLSLLSYLPLSAALEMSTTGLNKPEPGSSNWDYSLPQDVGLFLAGAFTPHAGGFIQATYDAQDDHFSWDNTDIRYARTGTLGNKEIVYGLDMNNNPTVEDLWNDTPAWGFPWVASPSAPTPTATPIIDGPLAQDVAGFGAYAMWDNHLYGDAAVYRSAHLGQPLPNTGDGFEYNIRGAAPYWRFAWQQTMGNSFLEVGTYGMHVDSSPLTVVGPTNTYTDVAFDSEFEQTLPKLHNDIVSIDTTYIHENSDLNAFSDLGDASLIAHHLNTFTLTGLCHFGYRYAPGIEYFVTTGNPDPLLYSPAAVGGSRNGSPNSQGFLFNFTYWPVQNVRLAAQYTAYTTFNGAGINYDGFGRKASNNNSLYLDVGLIF